MASAEPVILHESEKLVVFSKPAGWLSIPGREQEGIPVLSEWAKARFEKLWTVHRLDRDTSGVILFAKTPEAHREASLWFQKHAVKKLYHCLSTGVPASPVFKIDAPVSGLKSASQVEILFKTSPGFLAQVRPITGRRHQIRIHLSGSGFPIWGDTQYGGAKRISARTVADVSAPSDELSVPRVALHAWRLELPSGLKLEAPYPEDFSQWVDWLRSHAK